MKKRELMLLEAYLYNNQCRLECEVRQLQHNVRYRRIDSADCNELLIASINLEAFRSFSKDIRCILDFKSIKCDE